MVNHRQMFAPLPMYRERRVTCPLCRFLKRMSLRAARKAWGMAEGARFLDALARMDIAHRAMFANDSDAALLFDEPAGSPRYALAWLESFVNLVGVAPPEFLAGIPAPWLAAFFRAGAEVLGDAGLLRRMRPNAGAP